MRMHLSVLATGSLVLAAACAGGGTSPSPGTTPAAGSPTAAVDSPSPSLAASPSPSVALSPSAVLSPSPALTPALSPSASPATSPTGEGITVTAVDYAFEGVPSTVPAGTAFSLFNAGSEAHELVLVKKNEGVTETFEEILTLPDDEAFQLVTFVGGTAADPGQQAPTTVSAAEEGEYLMICFIPQGTTSLGEPIASPAASPAASPGLASPALSPSASPAAASPGASIPVGPPHFVLGMQQEFQVTEAGSSPGPIASPGASGSPSLESPGASLEISPELSPAVSP
jgi:uncharacterized cupredoxin-like copper-binding protein